MAFSSSYLPRRSPGVAQTWIQIQFCIPGCYNFSKSQLPLLGNEVEWVCHKQMERKCLAPCPVHKSRLVNVVVFISSFLPARELLSGGVFGLVLSAPGGPALKGRVLAAIPSAASRGCHHTDPGSLGWLFPQRPRRVAWARSFGG